MISPTYIPEKTHHDVVKRLVAEREAALDGLKSARMVAGEHIAAHEGALTACGELRAEIERLRNAVAQLADAWDTDADDDTEAAIMHGCYPAPCTQADISREAARVERDHAARLRKLVTP